MEPARVEFLRQLLSTPSSRRTSAKARSLASSPASRLPASTSRLPLAPS